MKMRTGMKLFVVAVACLFGGFASVSADGGVGVECYETRLLVDSEKEDLLSILETIQKAIPAPPQGWRINEMSTETIIPDVIPTDTGCPVGFTVMVEYANDENIMNNAQTMDFDKIEQLGAQMDEAAGRGDMQALQRIGEEMKALQSPKSMIAKIEMRVNMRNTIEAIEAPTPFEAPFTKCGFLMNQNGKDKVVLYVGNWKPYPHNEVIPFIAEDVSNTKTQLLEIIVEGGITRELVQHMNLKSLEALTR